MKALAPSKQPGAFFILQCNNYSSETYIYIDSNNMIARQQHNSLKPWTMIVCDRGVFDVYGQSRVELLLRQIAP